jgi:uncharacterized protein (DUF849 family)
MYFTDDSLLPENQDPLIITAAPDTRHMLTEIDPKPDQVTVAIGSSLYDMTPLITMDDVQGTHLANPEQIWAFSQMVADSTSDFYVEHLKRLKKAGIQPYFALSHVHSLVIVERLVRQGLHMGPMNGFFSMVGGGVTGTNPFDWLELFRRTPHGSVFTYQTMMRHSWPLAAVCIALGQHTRAGIEENLWDTTKGKRLTSVQMIEKHVRMANELGRKIATGDDAGYCRQQPGCPAGPAPGRRTGTENLSKPVVAAAIERP